MAMPATPELPIDAYARRRTALLEVWRRGTQATAGGPIAVGGKKSSNLFRDRVGGARRHIDLSSFAHVIAIDESHGWVDVEGLTPYETLVEATLARGVMPAVVPQLKTITVGGAIAGVGIEATSFRHGLVHQTVLEFDLVLPSGEIVLCTPTNPYRDLFFGIANSYGTLGYVLRARLQTIPVKSFVRVENTRHTSSASFFADLAAQSESAADFVDGVIFDDTLQVVSSARFVDQAPVLSDYTFDQIYFRSLPDKPFDFLTTRDYLWRWDTDWFWCSKNFGAQHPLVRRLFGRGRLNSRTYTRLMRWNARWGLTRALSRLRGLQTESVIQDVDIPAEQAGQFLTFLRREIGILPIWVCPIAAADRGRFPFYPLMPGVRYVNFGFWDVVRSPRRHPPGHFNKRVEEEVARLGGIKSLYSDCYMTRDQFAQAYNLNEYDVLKARFDPQGLALGLYEKCVLRR